MTTSESDSVSDPVAPEVAISTPVASDTVVEKPPVTPVPLPVSDQFPTSGTAATPTVSPKLDYQPAPAAARTTRLISLDALRGFDMFWIIGAEDVVHAVANVWPNKWTKLASFQMDHSPWVGFRFYDLIFPLFIFIVGVSAVFSLGKILATRSRAVAVRRVVIRAVLLYAIGILYYGGLANSFGDMYREHGQPVPDHPASAFIAVLTDIRLMGVLQRIAICYLFTGLLFIFFKPKVLAGIAAGLLVLYWALVSFVHPPGQEHASFDPGKNLTNWVDAHYLPGFKWGNELKTPDDYQYDPEGILSTIPAIGGCLLGVMAGLLLKSDRYHPYQKALMLIVFGAIAIGVGYSWGFHFPIIKKLWTSTFVLVTSGCGAVLLGVFYLVIDVWRLRFWAWPFVWIGMNAITLYVLWKVFELIGLTTRLVGGRVDHHDTELARHAPYAFTVLAGPVIGLLLIMSVARFLYKRQIFLRV